MKRCRMLGLVAPPPAGLALVLVLTFAVFSVAQTGTAPGLAVQPAVGVPVSTPQISRIEPPHWWIGLPPSPMLLLAGENLADATVTVSHPGVRVLRTEARPDGRHLLVWLGIASHARPGTVSIKVATFSGSTDFPFPLLARSDRRGKFQGVSPDDVIYLIMPDRFADGDPANDQLPQRPGTFDRANPRAYHGGDLRGVRDRLPYLRELGVTAIWLTPFWKNTDSDYHGYHVVDFYGMEDHFGSLRDLQELVADAHKQGIKVVLDFVVNHVGPKHPWAAAPPDPNWLHGTPQKHLDPVYNFAGFVDPHATARQYRNTLEGWFAGKLPDLNPDDPQLANYLLENAIWWTESAGLDAFRLDTFPYSSRRFWSGWHEGIFRAYPHTTTIGEVWDGDVTITSFFQGGRAQFDRVDSRVTTLFDFPLDYALRGVVLHGESVQKLIYILQRDWLYTRPDLLVTFIGNHDMRRFMSETGSSKEKLKAAFSLLLTFRGIPQIYYGDEIGMEGGDDPDNRRDFPGGFPGDRRNAFTAAGRTPDEEEIFSHVQALLRFRRAHPALRRGRHWHLAWDETIYAFARETREERLLMVFNNADQPRNVKLDLRDTPLAGSRLLEPLFAAQPATMRDEQTELQVAPHSVAIYAVK